MNREKKYIENLYNYILYKYVTPKIGNKTTFSNQLNNIAIKLFPKEFIGVFPSDKIPKFNNKKQYAILNLDKSNQSGSHWVGVVNEKNNIMFYDSFGRNDKSIIKNLRKVNKNKKIINTEDDIEQKVLEDNCGQRVLSWLILYHLFGPKYAKWI